MKRTQESVVEFLTARGTRFELRQFERSTRTAAESASQLGIPLEHIVKTLCFVADDRPVLVLCPGSHRVSMKKLKAITGCKKLPTAQPSRIEEWTGYAVGGVNPFFPNENVPIYCDPLVLQPPTVWFGAGSPTTLVSVPSEDLTRILPLLVEDIKE